MEHNIHRLYISINKAASSRGACQQCTLASCSTITKTMKLHLTQPFKFPNLLEKPEKFMPFLSTAVFGTLGP